MVATVLVATPLAIARGYYPTVDFSQLQFFQWTAALAAIALAVLGARRSLHRPAAGTLLVWIFALWSLLSVAWSRSPRFSLNEICALAAGVTLCLLIISIRLPTPRVVMPLLWVAVLMATFNAMVGDFQFILEKGPLRQTPFGALLAKALGYAHAMLPGKLNIRALFGHPNYLAGYLVPSLALACLIAMRPRGHRPAALLLAGLGLLWSLLLWQTEAEWRVGAVCAVAGGSAVAALIVARFVTLQRLVLALVVIGVFAGVVICRSRSGWGSFGIMTLVAALVALRHHRLRWWHVLILALIALIAVSGLLWLRQRHRRDRSIEEITTLSTVTSRVYTFALAAEMITRRPLHGWGHGTFKIEYYPALARFQRTDPEAAIYDPYLRETRGRAAYHVHNDYLEIAAETGLVGLAAFLALMTWTMVRLFAIALAPPAREQTWLALALACALLAMLCDMTLSYPLNLPLTAILFWTLLGLAHRVIADEETVPAI
jgi:O-antigen ligase